VLLKIKCLVITTLLFFCFDMAICYSIFCFDMAIPMAMRYSNIVKSLASTLFYVQPVGLHLPLFKPNWLKWSCDMYNTQRDKDLGLRLGFSLQFTQRKQEATNSLPALKLWQYLSIRLNCYRHYSQLSNWYVPTLSCDQFNQSRLAEGKNRHCFE